MHLSSNIPILFFCLLSLTSPTTALPNPDAKRNPLRNSNNIRKQSTSVSCSLQPPPTLPASTLPPPTQPFKHILLGRGTQNYTCNTVGAPPTLAGALATLYDISCFAQTTKSLDQVANKFIPNLLEDFGQSIASVLPDKAQAFGAGRHFFRADGTPMFVLDNGCFIGAGKVAACAAPATATGNANGAAVDWLKLVRKPAEVNGGLEEVYRVQTAGGRAPALCEAVGLLQVEYLAEYWAFGPGI